ncbi:MAG: NACHT domain-containing protein [Oculatellaceae cyanobacterium bins.114]|nr:NACHT domain-containing protein [Oculatellaceae cyanobacterium bins.114]
MMEAEEALSFVDGLLSRQGKRLTDLQRFVFLGTWAGKDYKIIHQEHEDRCSLDHLKRNVGYQLWKLLSEVLGEKVSKSTLQNCVYRARQQANEGAIGAAPYPVSGEQEMSHSASEEESAQGRSPVSMSAIDLTDTLFPLTPYPCIDWGEAPFANPFYTHTSLLNRLNDVVRVNLCRLLSLYGVSGFGKTAIALQLALKVRDQFEFVIWRSLKQAPLLPDVLADLTYHCSGHQESNGDLTCFMQYMTQHRCLIILDGFEAVLESGVHDGSYKAEYKAYGDLLRQVAVTTHESCLIITSWENPKEISETEGNHGYVHSVAVKGLGATGTQELLIDKRCLGTDYQWREIARRYWGHPFILSAIATTIREVFGGNVAWFLEQFSDPLIPEEMYPRLAQQLRRLSEAEQSIVEYLQQMGEPVALRDLQQALQQQMSGIELMKVLRSLNRRALVEVDATRYFLQELVMEYLFNTRGSTDT